MAILEAPFELYRLERSGALFGLSQFGDDVKLVDMEGGSYKVTKVSFESGVKRLALRLKAGYVKTGDRMYFNERESTFSYTHPDLVWKGLRWVLAAVPPDLGVAVGLLKRIGLSLPASAIFPEEIEAWGERQFRNARHVVAYNDHPVWALAIAQASLDHGWLLRASPEHGELPSSPPSISPNVWGIWLKKQFSETSVQDAQRALGWTMEKIILSGDVASIEDNLSAFI